MLVGTKDLSIAHDRADEGDDGLDFTIFACLFGFCDILPVELCLDVHSLCNIDCTVLRNTKLAMHGNHG